MDSLGNDWLLFGKMKVHTGLKYSDVVKSFEGYFSSKYCDCGCPKETL